MTSDFSLLNLARPAILRLKAYESARSLATSGEIFLDANENPWGEFNRYPDPQPQKLREKLASLYGVRSEQLFLGRGTDEAIDVLVRTFCEAGEEAILICPPTYGVYEVAASIQGAEIVRVPLRKSDFSVDEEALFEALTPRVKLVFLCSPNNPTGNRIDNETLERIARRLNPKALLVVDEAYVEFSRGESFSARLEGNPNVFVLRTLSKAWGLAGVRCGVALGNPELIALLQKVRAPYPLGSPSVQAALAALQNNPQERIDSILSERNRIALALGELPFVEKVYPSDANYLLFRVKNASAIMTALRERGIVIRDRSRDLNLENCLRVSVGSPEENTLFLKALSEVSRGV